MWSLAEGAKRVSQIAEGGKDVCLLAMGYCSSGATNSEWASSKVRVDC